MVDRKIEKIARMQSRGEDGKAGVSAWRTGKSRQIEATVSNQRGGEYAWCAGQQWNHLKYILEVVPGGVASAPVS